MPEPLLKEGDKLTVRNGTYFYRAIRLGDGLNLTEIAMEIGLAIPSPHSFALYSKEKNDSHVYILSYGVVVFCNADDEFIKEYISRLERFIVGPGQRLEDDLLAISVSGGQIDVKFDGIQLGRFDDSVNKMIMLHLAQSVVLDHFFYASQRLLTSVKEHTEYMQNRGKISMGQRETLRFIGRTLGAKNHIAENLYIMDSPEQTWDDEYLEVLHIKLNKHLDQAQRYRVIENTLRIVEANLSIYASYNNHRESSRLEWIIIILIVIEVINTFATELYHLFASA